MNLPEYCQDKLDELKDSKVKTALAWALKEMLRELWTQSDVDEASVIPGVESVLKSPNRQPSAGAPGC